MAKPRFQWDEPFELEGFWWPPEGADHAERHGTLRFRPDTGMELTVFDLFEEFRTS